MRVREIKSKLESVGIDTSDAFEKDELVKRLVDYSMQNDLNSIPEETTQNSTGNSTVKKKKKKKKKLNTPPPDIISEDEPLIETTSNVQSSIPKSNKPEMKSKARGSVTRVPLGFHSTQPSSSIPSAKTTTDNPYNQVFLRPSPGKYPSIQLSLEGFECKLTLLVDTACSGFILRPNIMSLYKLQNTAPNVNISMTAAAGTANIGGVSVGNVKNARMDDGTILEDMIVAGQDIGALPQELDGIIGLSFLKQFEKIAFDFQNGQLLLMPPRSQDEWIDLSSMELMAKSQCKTCRIGVWTVDMSLDGRGPVKMLLDSGAAATFLNWNGVTALNMDRSHPLIQRNTDAMGLMGADNVALQLTHRFVLKNRVNLTSDLSAVGAFGPLGIEVQSGDNGPLNIDIGDLPVLETLKGENVGGIVGSDLLMRCDLLLLDLKGSSSQPEISMYNSRDNFY
ncbi:hypothetical protein CTEN210_01104 [Chaetoceros tenuissimus]|uniref:Peptidase A2 domain-containing protein n=1 Tax=Chaetoceros tenuissimus TaxID=426638 RepID=A0AAD3GZC5_9STRA|nr:hypothetical protein CTEN210_01104 [Chaetoceros tenuissimus]